MKSGEITKIVLDGRNYDMTERKFHLLCNNEDLIYLKKIESREITVSFGNRHTVGILKINEIISQSSSEYYVKIEIIYPPSKHEIQEMENALQKSLGNS